MPQIGSMVLLALGQPAAGTTQNPKALIMQQVLLFVALGAVFYLLMIRPQQTKAKQHAELLKTIRPGDKVVTNGGILGIVISVKEKTLSIRSADAKLEVLKSAVSEITEKSASSTESKVQVN